MSLADINIVIVGAGIIGCTTAYYLTRHPSFAQTTTSVIILEASAHGAAQGASGKAGGLVAKWAYPRELVDLSFSEHVRLAQEHNGTDRWGWRFVSCGNWEGRGEDLGQTGSGVGKGGQRKSLEKTAGLGEGQTQGKNIKAREETGLPDDLNWVKEELTDAYSPMAPPGATAQVHPYLFTSSMLKLAQDSGAKFITGRATEIIQSDGRVTGIAYTDATGAHATIPATHIVLSAGAWSPALLPSLPVSGTRAHSVTIRPPSASTISPYVLFTEIAIPSSSRISGAKKFSPEIYARPDNEVYACGPGDDSELPLTVDDVIVDQAACDAIRDHVSSISQELRDGVIEKRQACYLPVVSSGGGPIIGEAKTVAKGLFLAVGHTCWGICNAPGTAKAVSELLMEGKIRCANLKKLDPAKFFI